MVKDGGWLLIPSQSRDITRDIPYVINQNPAKT